MLTVMTFNIRGALNTDGPNVWPQRASLNVQTIQAADPAVIGFQEVQAGNLEVYRQRLSSYAYEIGPSANAEDPHQYTSIFWKPDVLEKLDAGGFWLSETPEVLSGSWETACMRTATWVHFRMLDNGREFIHLNTHLDHVSAQARLAGSALIIQKLRDITHDGALPVLVTGDFNCDPASPPHRLWLQHGFIDSFLETGHEDSRQTNTFHGFNWSKPSSSGERRGDDILRMDWILLRDPAREIHPVTCEIVRTAQPPLYPSDHYPVVAQLAGL
ncbi:endonuclease/exonuclease/phosphatase family protein [Dictyobacter aurantiacus]|uniref:Endonuclease n=1 Tax=Dictyobacter aurantiacus TaxID=1936993 RepID=A0A401ZNA2_9CHLR|nr:endonuclease/exonuclease/phosphatase family protein [Dictyobacter aurantiacus]GCE08345.1 endonuclease [Dictyobacter aurantiacus]